MHFFQNLPAFVNKTEFSPMDSAFFAKNFVKIFVQNKTAEMFSRENVPAKRGPTKQEQQQMSMRSMHPKIGVFQTIFIYFYL